VPGRVWQRSLVPLRESASVELFVHPATAILLPNRHLQRAKRQRKAEWAERYCGHETVRPYAAYHVIDAVTQWHRVDGAWWEVRLARVP